MAYFVSPSADFRAAVVICLDDDATTAGAVAAAERATGRTGWHVSYCEDDAVHVTREEA